MSLFARSLNRFTGQSSDGGAQPNEQNITYRKKLSTVSTSLKGDDGLVAESPRNLYTRQNVVPLRRKVFDEPDGAMMSTGQTPVEKRAAEIRRMNSKKEGQLGKEENHAPSPAQIESTSSAPPTKANQIPKKPRTSTSSLASVFRSRASSPIERMRKFIGRSSSKQPKELFPPSPPSTSTTQNSVQNEKLLSEELEKVRDQLAQAHIHIAEQNKKLKSVQTVSCSQQSDMIPMNNMATMTEKSEDDKENRHPEIVCVEDSQINVKRIQSLKQQIALLEKENAEQKEDFRQTRKDFILILKEAVLRKDQAESELEIISKCLSDEDDWNSLMVKHRHNIEPHSIDQHRHTLRRNVLLMWVQKKLEPYSDQLSVSNFSSDWSDCRAFCALLYDLFPETIPDVQISPIIGDCVLRCRRAFQILEIPFDERSLGLASSPSPDTADDSSSASSYITGLTDWRYIMNTVFVLYRRGVLGK